MLIKGPKYCPESKINDSLLYLDVQKFIRRLTLNDFFYEIPPVNNDPSLIFPHSNFFPNYENKKAFSTYIQTISSATIDLIGLNSVENKENSVENKIAKSIRSLKDIIICKADKTNTIVILKKKDYSKLINEHIEDKETYIKVNHSKYENSKKQLLEFFIMNKEILTKKEYIAFTQNENNPCKFRVLPKLHKSKLFEIEQNKTDETGYLKCEIPMDLKSRPIVNNINSPTSLLSKFIDKILKKFVIKIDSYLKDSYEFLRYLPKTTGKKSILCTFDVTSLYTNIKHSLGLKAIEYYLDKYPDLYDARFTKEFIIKGLELILTNSIFYYENEYYLQICGTAMGTIVAPTYASLTLGFLETKMYEICKNINPILEEIIKKTFKRYLDDCFIIIDEDLIKTTHLNDILNSLDDNIKFTSETNKNSISYLDILVLKNQETISTDIFFKPTNNFNYIPFNSNHPRHVKRNIPYNLANRIKTIVSDTELCNKRLNEMKIILLHLNYPKKLIENAILKSKNTLNIKKKIQHDEKNMLPLVGTYSNLSKSLFNDKIKPIVNNMKMNIDTKNALSNKKIINSYRQTPNLMTLLMINSNFKVSKCKKPRCKCCNILIEYKNEIKINNHTIEINSNVNCTSKNVVYILFCDGCQQFYIGKTETNFNLRLNLHRNHIDNPTYTVLNVSRHIQQCKKTFKASILFQTKNEDIYLITYMENYFIGLLKPSLNA